MKYSRVMSVAGYGLQLVWFLCSVSTDLSSGGFFVWVRTLFTVDLILFLHFFFIFYLKNSLHYMF